MSTWGVAMRGVLRLAVLAAVLAGVLTMHGLTSDHHAAMTTEPPVSAAGVSTAPHGMSPDVMSPHLMAPAPSGELEVLPRSDAGHAMAGLCLAVLTGLSLLVLLARARAAVRRTGAVRLAAGLGRAMLTGRSPPGNTGEPTLSRLCVLRI